MWSCPIAPEGALDSQTRLSLRKAEGCGSQSIYGALNRASTRREGWRALWGKVELTSRTAESVLLTVGVKDNYGYDGEMKTLHLIKT